MKSLTLWFFFKKSFEASWDDPESAGGSSLNVQRTDCEIIIMVCGLTSLCMRQDVRADFTSWGASFEIQSPPAGFTWWKVVSESSWELCSHVIQLNLCKPDSQLQNASEKEKEKEVSIYVKRKDEFQSKKHVEKCIFDNTDSFFMQWELENEPFFIAPEKKTLWRRDQKWQH